jgi:IAA-amino acid hydrolase
MTLSSPHPLPLALTGPGAFNVIPNAVTLQGTLRALTDETFDLLHTRIKEVASLTAAAHGCSTTFSWSPVPYPPTVNHPDMAELVRHVSSALTASPHFPNSTFTWLPSPSMPAEDFSFYGKVTQAAFTFLGLGDEGKGSTVNLHNPRFMMNEEVMPLGAALHASLALEALGWLQREGGQGGGGGGAVEGVRGGACVDGEGGASRSCAA